MPRILPILCAAALLIAPNVCRADVPTRAQLERELTLYMAQAKLRGDSALVIDFRGVPYSAVFDLFLAAMNDPDHPKYAPTKQAWDANHALFRKQASTVSHVMGNLIPLFVTASELYAKDYGVGATRYSPNFKAKDYVQPLAIIIGVGETAYRVAWYHGKGDADCDGITNAEELLTVAPNWKTTEETGWILKRQTRIGVTEEQRKQFVKAALGTKSACYPTSE